jgi:predicted phosphoribosyltransferase
MKPRVFPRSPRSRSVARREAYRLRKRSDVLVLAPPRAGATVALEIVRALHVPINVFVVCKLGIPGHAWHGTPS